MQQHGYEASPKIPHIVSLRLYEISIIGKKIEPENKWLAV